MRAAFGVPDYFRVAKATLPLSAVALKQNYIKSATGSDEEYVVAE